MCIRNWPGCRSYLHCILGIKTLEEAKVGNSYTENNFTANINHYHADDSGDNGDTRATVNDNVSREFISKETLEDSR